MKIPEKELTNLKTFAASLDAEWTNWRPHQQDLAKYLLPRRYIWLDAKQQPTFNSQAVEPTGSSQRGKRNEYILDPAGTQALRVLGAGMMNGITSPARPWFVLRFADLDYEETTVPGKIYLQEVVRRMLIVFAESNFYNAIALMHLELPAWGTAAMLVYEDFDDVIRCYNSPHGEYRLAQDHRRKVSTFYRGITMTVAQLVGQFGIENVSDLVKQKWESGKDGRNQSVSVAHLIEPNVKDARRIGSQFAQREYYWEMNRTDGKLLALNGYHEPALVAPRWEVTGNDTYGTGPAHDALPEIIQLQHMVKRKAQGLDKMVSPPLVADISLESKPNALFPGGISYVPFASQTVGAKPIYTVQPPFNEMTQDIMQLHERIQRIFYNHLFTGVTDLNTVRSATEIIERTNEKLVMLGPVLERVEHEALDVIIKRTFGIMQRKGLLPEPPEELADMGLEVQYVSVLANAQRAQTTASTERFFEVVGNLAAINPEILDVPNFEELLRDYADKLQVPAKGINPREVVAGLRQQREAQLEAQQAAQVGSELTDAAKNLSETDVGGGQNALSAMLG